MNGMGTPTGSMPGWLPQQRDPSRPANAQDAQRRFMRQRAMMRRLGGAARTPLRKQLRSMGR